MAEVTENLEGNIQDGIGKIERFVEENKQKVMIGGGVVALLIVGVIYLFAKYLPEQNLKAQKAMYMAEFAFAKDSFALALNGNAANKGFSQVANDYGWTASGKLANYYAGICALNLKKYDDAVKYLDKFSTSDPIIGALRLNALGDAKAELGNIDDAISSYEKAAAFSDNESYTPYYLFKAGLANEKAKKPEEAKKLYQQLKDKYPNSEEGRDIEKYIARVSTN